MRVGIVRYPGSNCDIDTLNYFPNSFYIWHNNSDISILKKIDLLVIPGGFAFGDRYYEKATSTYTLDPGQMAVESPVSKVIIEAVEMEIPILGICNGFQILIKLGLLPGQLILNNDKLFHSKPVSCKLITHLTSECNVIETLDFNIANSFGNYQVSHEEYISMEEHSQIFLKYDGFTNGSYKNIAGVCNKKHTIYGLMPHPERQSIENDLFKLFIKDKILNNKFNSNLGTELGMGLGTELGMGLGKELGMRLGKQKFTTNIDPSFSKRINDLFKSEHISYKSTKQYLSNLYTKNKNVVQGPGENAGIIDIGDGYCLALRIESHNHPIFIDPYNGAATGVGGILRDIFTMGARPIAILDFLRFGIDAYNDTLIDKTIKGISDYCNCFGVANVGGDFYRGKIYNNNPLLNVGCIGIVKKENIIYGNALNKDSLLIYVGSKTGNEGINGALMSSNQFNVENMDFKALKKNIQVGDPFLEKLLLEACNEISKEKLAEGMQDMGAGGVLCATIEVIKRGRDKTNKNLGCEIYVDKIPVKYEMDNCDKLISESQERMLIVANSNNIDEIFRIFKKWDLEYSIIGKVTDNGVYEVFDETCDSLNMEKIYEQNIESFDAENEDWELKKYPSEKYNLAVNKIKNIDYWTTYDNTIGCRTIKGPLEPGHYSILDLYEINKKLVITWGETFDTCYNKMIELNGKPLGLINCMNFGHPRDSMGAFVDILNDFNTKCKKYDIPIVGGNVSLYNATNNISIKPTPILVMVGLL